MRGNNGNFVNPDSRYRSKPFWAWNGKLQEHELRRQLDVMKEMGMGGAFMHSRVGLGTEYLSEEWFRLINACADQCGKGPRATRRMERRYAGRHCAADL